MSSPPPVARALVWSAGWNTAGFMVAAAFNFAVTLVVTRSLGVEGYAQYSYLLWLASVGSLLASAGLARPITRFAARARGQGHGAWGTAIVRRSSLFVAVLGVGLGPALTLVAPGIHSKLVVVPVALLTVCIVCGAVASIQAAALQGRMGFRGLAIANVVTAGLLLTASFAVALQRGAAEQQFAAAALPAVALVILQGLLLARRVDPPSLLTGGTDEPSLVAQGFRGYWLSAVGLLLIEAVVWQRPEVLFLAAYSSTEELGYYNAAWALASRLVLLATFLGPVLLAQVAGMRQASDARRMQAIYSHSSRWLCLLATPAFLLTAGLAGPVLRLLYGPAFEPAAAALRILSLGGLVACVSVAGSAVVYGTDRIGFALRWGAVAAVATLLLNLLLIPSLGSIGAAIANVGGQALAVSATVALALAPSGYRFPWGDSLRALAAGIAAAGAASLVTTLLPGSAGLLAGVAIGLGTYACAVLVSGALRSQDWWLVQIVAPGLPQRSAPVRAILTWALGPAPTDRPST